MADSAIKPPDPIDWNNYDDGGSGKKLPPPGEYSLTPVTIDTTKRTDDGYFKAVIDLRVNDPGKPHDGHVSRFNNFSTKAWPNKNGSPLGDYLRGHGIRGPLQTDAQYEAAVKATINKPFKAMIDAEYYDSASNWRLKGWANFPTNPDGTKQTVIERNGQKLFANVRVKYVVSTVPRTSAA